MSGAVPLAQQVLSLFVVGISPGHKQSGFQPAVRLQCTEHRAIALIRRQPHGLVPHEVVDGHASARRLLLWADCSGALSSSEAKRNRAHPETGCKFSSVHNSSLPPYSCENPRNSHRRGFLVLTPDIAKTIADLADSCVSFHALED